MEPNAIYTDLNETFQAAMSYVILSRITNIGQLYLKDFKQSKIYCNPVAKREAKRLRARAINKKQTVWNEEKDNFVRITSLNARSLQLHRNDLKNDEFIMQSDILCIQETWLSTDLDQPMGNFEDYYIHRGSKGIALFSRLKPLNILNLYSDTCTIIKATYDAFDLINVYRFSDTNINECTEEVLTLINLSRTQIIVGDMNIDIIKDSQNSFTQSLQQKGFRQMVERPTHELGGLIDHVYFYSPSSENSCTLYKYHTVFWSDHLCQSLILNLSQDS